MTSSLDPVRFPMGIRPVLSLHDRRPEFLRDVSARMLQATSEWRELLVDLDEPGLARTYRTGGFNVRLLAHHVTDAHLHGLNRLRHGLTENDFVIAPFDPDAWAALPDSRLAPAVALNLLEATTAHWVALLTHVIPAEFAREIVHPQEGRQDLWQLVSKHDWHLRHHLEHARLALHEGSSA